MRKSRFSLLVVATVIATILIAGCTSPTQTSPQVASTNASSTTASTTTNSSSAVKTAAPSATPSPSASASPTQVASPTPTTSPTPTESPSGKIATSIAATGLISPPLPTPTSGQPINWGIQVTSQATGLRICPGSGVSVLINGKAAGQVSYVGGSQCGKTAYFTLSSGLQKGTYTVTLRYSGDSTYQPIASTFQITVNP
ncbi:MAG: Ig-like domain repeat protein [Halobacteriota archaeon]|jgi:outer membrane murein-binding lipoprotein Lpp